MTWRHERRLEYTFIKPTGCPTSRGHLRRCRCRGNRENGVRLGIEEGNGQASISNDLQPHGSGAESREGTTGFGDSASGCIPLVPSPSSSITGQAKVDGRRPTSASSSAVTGKLPATGGMTTAVVGANAPVGPGEGFEASGEQNRGPVLLPNTLNATAEDRYAAHRSHSSHSSHGSHRSSSGGTRKAPTSRHRNRKLGRRHPTRRHR